MAPAEDLRVEIDPILSLSAGLVQGKDFAAAGSDYELTFHLANTGNTDARVSLNLTGTLYSGTVVDVTNPTTLAMPAGAGRDITVAVSTDRTQRRSQTNTVTISAVARGQAGGMSPSVYASASTEIIPVSESGGSAWHSIPASTQTMLSLEGSQALDGSVSQSVTVKGALDPDGLHRIDAEIRKDVATDQDLLRNVNDRYTLDYQGPWAELRLGDGSNTLSPLLVSDQWGRGALIALDPGLFRFTGLYYQDILSGGQRQGLGGTVGFALPGAAGIQKPVYQANLGVLSPLDSTASLDLWQQYEPAPWLSLQLDGALRPGGVGSLAPAVYADARGDTPSWFYQVQFLRAWPGFAGTWSDEQTIFAGSGMRFLNGALTIYGSWDLDDRNLLLDPQLLVAPRNSQASVDIAGKIDAWRAQGKIDWTNYTWSDLLSPQNGASTVNNVTLSWTQKFSPVSLDALTQLTFSNLANGINTFGDLHSVALGWERPSGNTYSVSLQYAGVLGAGLDRYSPGISSEAVFVWPRSSLDLKTIGTLGFGDSGWVGGSVILYGTFKYTFPWGHQLGVEGYLSYTGEAGASGPSFSLALSYGAALDVPVSRSGQSAVVRGSVVHDDTGAPISGVIVRLGGLSAVTGQKGEFRFDLSSSGTRYLRIDPTSLHAGLIPDRAMPIQVDSAAGTDIAVKIGIVQGSTIHGSIDLYELSSQADAFAAADSAGEPQREKRGGLANAVVELIGSGDRKRRVTSPDGTFLFQEVVPGTYTLQVADDDLPANHKLESESASVSIGPGEQKEIDFKLLEQRRPVQIIDSDVSVVAPPSAQSGGVAPSPTPSQ